MEGITPYSQWNKFRSRFSDIYREPAKVIMKDFHVIYPELMDSMSFPEFSQDYLEVSDQVPVSSSAPVHALTYLFVRLNLLRFMG